MLSIHSIYSKEYFIAMTKSELKIDDRYISKIIKVELNLYLEKGLKYNGKLDGRELYFNNFNDSKKFITDYLSKVWLFKKY